MRGSHQMQLWAGRYVLCSDSSSLPREVAIGVADSAQVVSLDLGAVGREGRDRAVFVVGELLGHVALTPNRQRNEQADGNGDVRLPPRDLDVVPEFILGVGVGATRLPAREPFEVLQVGLTAWPGVRLGHQANLSDPAGTVGNLGTLGSRPVISPGGGSMSVGLPACSSHMPSIHSTASSLVPFRALIGYSGWSQSRSTY